MSPFETLRACRVSSASGGLPNLLRYETFAVAHYGCMSHALHLRQTRQSLNLGENEILVRYQGPARRWALILERFGQYLQPPNLIMSSHLTDGRLYTYIDKIRQHVSANSRVIYRPH